MLTSFMEQNTDVAKSFSPKGNNYKESHKMLWEKLSKTLNANGPPTKSTREWKRIWTTRKYSVKKKLLQNQKSLKETGGGPFMELPLDTNEETIVKVCGIKAAIAGISGVSSCGGEDENEEIKILLSDKIG
ncbi:uncharacterized protein LOC129953403 isoform X2 [Eupeodes corollae]|nr:uncharacterized protein LOC129953403 isoform X2 [Eupeodes corollae]